jgi:hypothetical protein
MSCVIFWVVLRRKVFNSRRFGTLHLFHLHRRVDAKWVRILTHFASIHLWRWNRHSVPKRRLLNTIHQSTTRKLEIKNWYRNTCKKGSILSVCLLFCMGVKLGCWQWGRNIGWGCLRMGCWVVLWRLVVPRRALACLTVPWQACQGFMRLCQSVMTLQWNNYASFHVVTVISQSEVKFPCGVIVLEVWNSTYVVLIIKCVVIF